MNPPDDNMWAQKAVLAACIALLGYIGKGIVVWCGQVRRAERKRRSRLVELLAIIRAGDTAWKVQCEKRDELNALIAARVPALVKANPSFDRQFALAFPDMAPAEHELHEVVRAYTVHAFRPLNKALLKWLSIDTEFRVGKSSRDPKHPSLAQYLAELEAHLLLWQAKFTAWIPAHPEHALVYLNDEEKHGTPFPEGGAALVANALSKWWIRA